MSVPRFFLIFTIAIFSLIGLIALFKQESNLSAVSKIEESTFQNELHEKSQVPASDLYPPSITIEVVEEKDLETVSEVALKQNLKRQTSDDEWKQDDWALKILFDKKQKVIPIVEKITYTSRPFWMEKRPAWLADYAAYYKTSRHFIARSLNGKPNYEKQDLMEGDTFNVLKKDLDLRFYLLCDLSKRFLKIYALDYTHKKSYLLATYPVGLGKVCQESFSGSYTPLGKFTLGSKIAVFHQETIGFHEGKKQELVRVYGTRWIPLIPQDNTKKGSEQKKGLGLHGVPMYKNQEGQLEEIPDYVGKYVSDGCLILSRDAMESVFALVVTRPSELEIVRDFQEAKPLPF